MQLNSGYTMSLLRKKLKKRKSTIEGGSLLESLTAKLGNGSQLKRGPIIKPGDISEPNIEKEILSDGR